MPAHAHLMLLGFVVSTLYAIVYHLWLPGTGVPLAMVQTVLHEIGAVVLGLGLVLMFGGTLLTRGPSRCWASARCARSRAWS